MSGIKEKAAIGVGVGIAVSALTGAYYWYQAKVRNAYPKAWRRVGTLSNLAYSPIKSCKAIYLNDADCKAIGIEKGQCRDHVLMLIDGSNKVVTARGYPHMLKIKQVPNDKGITVSAPGIDPLEIQYSDIGQGDTIKASIFGSDVFVVECGRKYDDWFSKFIDEKERVKLVFYPYHTPTRIVEKALANGIFLNEDTGALQDISSYMLINEASVNDLNKRLKRPINPMQFRPSFLVKTDGPAYDEDNWNWIKIGNDAVFRTVAPCYRCILPNINMETAERDPDGDPLTTLKSYRCNRSSKSPVMGLQLGIRTPGYVKVGDEVFVGA